MTRSVVNGVADRLVVVAQFTATGQGNGRLEERVKIAIPNE